MTLICCGYFNHKAVDLYIFANYTSNVSSAGEDIHY